jgi:putative ABC transport system permease protein
MVVGMGVFASSLKASFGSAITESTKADLFLSPASLQAGQFSPEASKKAAEVPGVRIVSQTGWGQARIAGSSQTFSSVDPATADEALILDLSAGRAGDLGTDGLLVAKTTAAQHGWTTGDVVPVEFPTTGKHELRVAGIFDRKGFIDTPYVMSLAAHDKLAGGRLDTKALILLDEGADRAAVQAALTTALAGYPDAKVLDGPAYEKEAAGFVDQLLGFVMVMLLLAVVIALLGIVNTLALSVFERTRELGLLRAIGMSGAQVRAMVRYEAAVIALIGSGAGAVLGIGLGVAMTKALEDQGMGTVAVPGAQIGAYVVLAALAGVLAAAGPARRAAKVDVLRAVVTD